MSQPLSRTLRELENESIHILREVAATFSNPVLLYSIGKDSSVLLHLARKAFHPAGLPFKVMHIDTGWKFREMIAFRDRVAARHGLDLLVYTNQAGAEAGMSPLVHGSSSYTDVMKTQALRQALDLYKFDAAIGGARRDEEKSRAKERIFSIRNRAHGWDPKLQRPELWRAFNSRLSDGQSMRVFPLSNWTELDVWEYILAEQIEVVDLYFARSRPTVLRDGGIIMLDDDRLSLREDEVALARQVRFRTLGCYPLTAAIESGAQSIADIVAELRTSRLSERQGRMIDRDEASSMERKKREGYF
ncbi:sulfate adenylyltransferase subunit CysD [Bradyrhizobium sp. AUGA SZCCT0182]|uniref:sulfate adenylyltransferase subunit CysD n=1 Tax=Bradyrhizobium sp. AUGA SZCCT0182 TaxID=2807667 RepID=UPI001BA92B87|nr:sulfate adenylyltransferase subunit CysD [Bradyrhizobium sp. AUGA SZCCT0182]MBR1236306.1 sulfate adenylyltransferase subunit CysD [Bradyrhizobium sp. AUGA SZCCT0182]